jgi:dihydroxyacid dehydratase/phosphogluconate dehydratase
LAAVRDGDVIRMDVSKNMLELVVSDEEIAARLSDHKKISFLPDTAWSGIFKATVLQAWQGADIDASRLEKE